MRLSIMIKMGLFLSLLSTAVLAASIQKYILQNPERIGVTSTGQSIYTGGLSGLRYLGISKGKLLFLTLTDRGPNAQSYSMNNTTNRPFLLPDFNPQIIILAADPQTKTLQVINRTTLLNKNKKIRGLPQNVQQEHPVDIFGHSLVYDKEGIDPEGIDIEKNGTYWIGEEYGPALLHFNKNGVLLDRYAPGQGLPKELKWRALNRGFEGITLYKNTLFAIVQSPLHFPKTNPSSKNIRLIQFDLQTKQVTAQYFYRLQGTGSDRIGDLVAIDSTHFLVIEQNDDDHSKAFKKIFLIDLSNATNLSKPAYSKRLENGQLESLNLNELQHLGIHPVKKKLCFDLTTLGVSHEKIEGITLIDKSHFAVINDNDFNLEGHLNRKTGKANFKNEASFIYVLPLDCEKYAQAPSKD